MFKTGRASEHRNTKRLTAIHKNTTTNKSTTSINIAENNRPSSLAYKTILGTRENGMAMPPGLVKSCS